MFVIYTPNKVWGKMHIHYLMAISYQKIFVKSMHLDKQIAWKSNKFHFLCIILKYSKRISSYTNVILKSERILIYNHTLTNAHSCRRDLKGWFNQCRLPGIYLSFLFCFGFFFKNCISFLLYFKNTAGVFSIDQFY